jgi:GTPase involved in cell partitioning and DNA repair
LNEPSDVKPSKVKGKSTLDNYKKLFVADLSNFGDEVLIVKGGKGGTGML